MDKMQNKLVVGFIAYGESSAKYLPYFMESLKNQIYKDFQIICHDNSEEAVNPNYDYLRQNYPQVKILRAGGNLGFAKAFNVLIKTALEQKADYFFALNPDMILEPEAIEKLINALDGDSALGSAGPLVLKWNFTEQKKTDIIDTCGIGILAGLRFVDVAQGQLNRQWPVYTKILGPSGAAALYRVSALEAVKQGEEYFDELMFMYKEDCDLAYRLSLAGFKSVFVPNAAIYHDRTATAKGENDLQVALNRKNKNRQVKRWSFLNQQIIFVKYWRLQSWKNKSAIVWFELKMLVFILLFERYLLAELGGLKKLCPKIKKYDKKDLRFKI